MGWKGGSPTAKHAIVSANVGFGHSVYTAAHEGVLVCLLPRCGFSHRRRFRLVPTRKEKTRSIHQGATEGTRTRVRCQQIYHERQTEENICPD